MNFTKVVPTAKGRCHFVKNVLINDASKGGFNEKLKQFIIRDLLVTIVIYT
jgi:hypothetical protein